ncbi:hypothetical protein HPB50_004683 [Hyalomma asiaticum]|uniref:Uncharacterized protein n=1 Tax=Hyalomma asiaticum TaxID=266040 RepID=A0ACB7SSM0_HYAAI|nr:hypothetical protein HPB50_004683 [Hyalomma asiaticum]
MAAFSPHSAAWFPSHSSPHVHMQGMPEPQITYPVHYAFTPPPFNNQQVYPAPSGRFLQERPIPQVMPDQWPMTTLHTTDQLPLSPQPEPKQKKRRRNRNQRSESAGQLIPEQDDDGNSSNAASVIPKRPRNARHSSQSTRWAAESQSSEPYEEPLPPKRTPKSCYLFPLALLAVVVIVVIFGSAGRVLKVISEEFPPGGAIVNRRGLPTPEKPILRAQPASTRRTECNSESCQWQSRYLHDKLNHSVSPCKDFYSHVCSNEWFRNANDSLKPYAYSASTSTMLGLWDILKQHSADSKTTTFVTEASQFMRRCVPGSKKDTDWKVFRRILSDFGIDEWPYGDSVPEPGAHNIAAKAEKMLGFSTLVSMSLRERPTTHEIMLHVNSPPILLRLYKDAYPGKDIKAYGEFVFEVLSLWNPGGHDILPSVLALMDLEERISIAASHSTRSVPVLHVTLPIAAIRSYPHWNWQSYFQHFLDGNLAQHSSSNIALLDPVYFNHLTSILSRATTRTLLNYVGYKLVVFLSPLLPSNKADFMVPLSYHHHLATGVSRRLEACMFLLERLYSIPTRALVWSHLLKKAPSLSSGDIADELQNMEHLARNEMKQAATHTAWLTQEEASVAVLKIERMKLILAPNNREDTFRQLHVASRISDDASFIEAVYNSQRNLREKYWRGDNLSLFHEPVTAADSAFVPGFVYEPDRNELTVSPVTVDFIVGISRHPDATSVPFLLGEVLRGMFSAMSIRGSTIDADGDVRHWWTSTTEDRFVERAKCLQNSFADETRLYIQEELRDKFVFMEENVQDGAVLRPLYNIHRWLTKNSGKSGPIPGQPKGLGPSKLFFINWASTFCEPEQPQEVARDRLHFKISVPPRTRLNVALSRFPPFSATFKCPVGSEMNPTKACSFW